MPMSAIRWEDERKYLCGMLFRQHYRTQLIEHYRAALEIVAQCHVVMVKSACWCVESILS